MDWFDLLEVQGNLKSLLQHHSLKVSILWCSTFFIVQLSHPYMTTGKTIALIRQDVYRILKIWLILCWRRLLRVPWTARRTSQSILREINPEYSLEGPMLKLEYSAMMQRASSLEKDPGAGKD